ncbi:MAG TPA: HEPN domain-containing protein [Azospirillum sp.]
MVIESVLPWLGVVEQDMKAIRNNLYGPDPVPTVAAYHCQQAAEKLVKATLVSLSL